MGSDPVPGTTAQAGVEGSATRSCQPCVGSRREQVWRDLLECWAMRLVSGGGVPRGPVPLVEEIQCMGTDAS